MTTPHPLEGPRLKVRRAKSEIDLLAGLQDVFIKDAKYQVVRAEFNPKTQKQVHRLRVEGPESPPHDWGVLIGEIAHNLRSALDGLTWQLALLQTDTPASRTQFPVFRIRRTKRKGPGKNLIPHFEDGGRNMIRDLSRPHQAVIEGLQPYKRRRGVRVSPSYHPLYLLSEINNADKHRTLQVAATTTGAFEIASSGDLSSFTGVRGIRVLKDGAKLFELAPDVTMHPHFVPVISFWEGCEAVKPLPVCGTLGLISRTVSNVVESFAWDFG